MTTSTACPAAGAASSRRPRLLRTGRRAGGELLLLGSLFLLYKLGRSVGADHEAVAAANAQAVHGLEHTLHLPSEAAVQALLGSPHLYELANAYYLAAHFPVTVAFLVWGFTARPAREYAWARNLLITQTFAALLLHIGFPLSPPRMFPQWGFLDTAAAFGPSAYGGHVAQIANQHAAMPSLHIGWAALIALVVVRTGPRWLAALAVGHATLTTAVVIVTANHWWSDGLVSLALLAVAVTVFPAPGRSRSPSSPGVRRPGGGQTRSAVVLGGGPRDRAAGWCESFTRRDSTSPPRRAAKDRSKV